MVGKSYKSASEAFKDADYANAIERPADSGYSWFWGFVGALVAIAVFGYCFYLTISRF
jgi:hypothetical protein